MPPIDAEREVIGRSIAATLMARHIRQWNHIHAETILTEIGALAGFAAQISIRKSIIEPQHLDPDTVLIEAITKNDERYYFSDLLNLLLFENVSRPPYSIWAYLVDAVPREAHVLLPEMEELVSRTARTIGTPAFGLPRLPADRMPRKLPRAALNELWPLIQQELSQSRRDAAEWPYDLAFAARWQMRANAAMVPLPLAVTIVMEAAVPMSKVDPRTVPGAS
jgi:hypothetical protein